uniref:Uncharacterized protein n=1 Tax=Hyaloperonospora arabidopsidis (strain Emoy2) TaxID=559515 RepID=M4B7U0_HYAAE
MLEAQRTFQNVVKHELQLLLASGTKREDAVKLLLGRIVASTEPPEALAVRGVMRQFQMNCDDAVRALIVKQELGRLKRQGLDSFAAIEELTRKMKSRGDERQQEKEREEKVEVKGAGGEVREERGSSGENDVEEEDGDTGGVQQDKVGAAVLGEEMSSVTSDKEANETTSDKEANETTSDKEANESTSLSLCQRIGKVSISSVTVTEQESDDGLRGGDRANNGENEAVGERSTTGFRSPSRAQSSSNGNLVELTPQSRKRRATFGEQLDTVTRSRSSSSERTMKPMFSGMKKQKLRTDVGDGFLQIVSRKSKPMSSSPPKGTAAKSTSGMAPGGGKGGGLTRSERNTKNLVKRQRASPTGMADNDESPIAAEPRSSHVHHRHHAHHHHSKRQKSGSPH